jgi:Arc/MetJ family transcription regulator
VDFALRKAIRRVASVDELLALEGIGFDLDLDEIRNEDLSWVDKPEGTKD